jgi:signal transduction histidine kinase
MLAALRRVVHLSEQMLAYSRASAPYEDPPEQTISLREIVAECIAEIEPRFRARGMQLTLTGADAGEVHIRGDRHKIASVISNLLDNALNYAPEGSPVEVELSCGEGRATMSVIDQGAGIPVDMRERVFESYFRIPGSAGSGSGLGLAIVKEIALQHEATVEIGDGPDGCGTRVSVSFPLLPANSPKHNFATTTDAARML